MADLSHGPSILIVDDDPDILKALQEFFVMRGYFCMTTTDGRQALGMLANVFPSVVVVDIRLNTEISGFDILRRTKELLPTTKVIVMTGFTDEEYPEKAKELKADWFIRKPVTPEKILEFLEGTKGASGDLKK